MITPGSLVSSRHMSDPCRTGYEIHEGRAWLVGDHDTFAGLALVIAVINPTPSGVPGAGVVCLWLSRKQLFVFTWISSVREVEQ